MNNEKYLWFKIMFYILLQELLDACGAIVIKDPRCFNFVPHKLLRVILTDKEDVCEVAIGNLIV